MFKNIDWSKIFQAIMLILAGLGAGTGSYAVTHLPTEQPAAIHLTAPLEVEAESRVLGYEQQLLVTYQVPCPPAIPCPGDIQDVVLMTLVVDKGNPTPQEIRTEVLRLLANVIPNRVGPTLVFIGNKFPKGTFGQDYPVISWPSKYAEPAEGI